MDGFRKILFICLILCSAILAFTSSVRANENAANKAVDSVIKEGFFKDKEVDGLKKHNDANKQKPLAFKAYNEIREQFVALSDKELLEYFKQEQEVYFTAIDGYLAKVKSLAKGKEELQQKLLRIKDIERRMKLDGTSKAEAEEYSRLIHDMVNDASLAELQEDYDHNTTLEHYNSWRAARYEMVYRKIAIEKQYEEQ